MNSSRCIPCLAVVLLFAGANRAPANEIRMPRHPDYSEGKIVFSYLGDLWLVNDDGANPRRLTTHAARDSHPKFSPDGKWIAFSSNRFGNDDVFVMPTAGGTAKRLTYNSAPDQVTGWSRDGKRVMFSSARGRVFGGLPSLYEVPVDGGAETPLPTDWGTYASYSPDGKQLAFNRHPAPWSRKHYRGSYSADLWLADLDAKTFKKMLDADMPDDEKPNNMWPMFGRDAIYFVSDRAVRAKAGSPEVLKSVNNIWKLPLNGSPPQQITQHTSGSLFWPSISADGRTIVYEENFGLYKLDLNNGNKPVEVKIDIVADERENNFETRTVTNEADAFNLSPSGKRAVISVEGDLFSIPTDRGEVHRITNGSGAREGNPQWSPDGKWIAFVSDQSGREEIWLCDEHGGAMKMLTNADTIKGAPVWSPDSKALLYSASDKKLHKFTLDSNQDDVIADGDVVSFGGMAINGAQWSPDGKWVSFTRSDHTLLPHVFIVAANGGEARRITSPDTYSDSNAHWTPDGKKIVYMAGSDVGNIGAAGRSTAQLYAISLAAEDKDPSDRGVDSEAAAEAETQRGGRGPRPGGDAAAAKPDVKIDFDRMHRRARQLTRSGDTVQGIAVSPDSKSLVFVTSGVEGGRNVQSIWQFTFDGERTTRLTQSTSQADGERGPPARGGGGGGFGSLQFAKDGRTLFYRSGRNIYALSIGGGGAAASTTATAPAGGGRRGGAAAPAAQTSDSTPGSARQLAFTAKVEIDHAKRRQQVFNEAWRVMKTRFYDPRMHGVDWDHMKSQYEPMLQHIAEQDDLYDLVNMMIGELNASHTGHAGGGGRGRARGDDASDQTRYPGFDLEPDGGFYKVTHIYKDGPADKDFVKIKVGDYVLAVDGKDLKAGDNYWKNFTVSPGARFEFTLNSKPDKDGAWTTKITPVSGQQFGNLQYQRWVDERRALVDKLSNGEIGYLHIRQMNEPSLRQFERDLGLARTKKALVIDQRFNPGGSIDQELLEILGQRQYQYTRQRDSIVVQRPLAGFFGPKVVMENERSTSDAEVFPDGFRTLKLGKVVGVTTYGAVIGTGSFTLMDGSTIRTPGSGLWNVNGTNLENYGVPPDVYVDNTPTDFLQNRDAQIEKAVEVLKEEMQKTKKDR